MAATALVDTLFENGVKLVEALDQANLDVYAAYWMYSDESESWTFNIGSRLLSANGPQGAYRAINNVLTENHIDIPLHTIVVVAADDHIVRLMRGAFRFDGTNRIPFTNNVVNGVRMPEMVILRFTEPVVAHSKELKTDRGPRKPPISAGRLTAKHQPREERLLRD
jgi:hypothetical protein